MRHDRGLAASPPLRYTLTMGGCEPSPFPYPPPVNPPFARRQRSSGERPRPSVWDSAMEATRPNARNFVLDLPCQASSSRLDA